MPDGQPWMKFYPSDWRADQALRVCSLAARGLWMECICIMHEADPYGHLLINGRPATDTQLATLTGVSEDQLAALLSELEAAGVFSRNRKGVIYSRRMTRDRKRAKTSRKNGNLGGNPTLLKQRRNSDWDNPPDKPGVKGGDNTQRPEARKKDSESPPKDLTWIPDSQPRTRQCSPGSPRGDPENGADGRSKFPRSVRLPSSGNGRAYPSQFETFWRSFPTRPTDTKRRAYDRWRAAANHPGVGWRVLQQGCERYAAFISETGHPSKLVETWIEDEGWTADHRGGSEIEREKKEARSSRLKFIDLAREVYEIRAIRNVVPDVMTGVKLRSQAEAIHDTGKGEFGVERYGIWSATQLLEAIEARPRVVCVGGRR